MQTYFTGTSYTDIPNLATMMNWDDKKKIYLISLLSNSLLSGTGGKINNISEEDYTMQMINRFAGDYHSINSYKEFITLIPTILGGVLRRRNLHITDRHRASQRCFRALLGGFVVSLTHV